MKLVDYEKYYHSGSEFIIPRDEFEKIIEENQRLKEEYIMLQNASEEYEDKLLKENQRLNNVLNELEKWLKDKQNLVCGCGITADYIYAYETVLDYLSELKESDK
jgi:hypothetical protein